MDRISIDFISVLGLPPVEFAQLAAELGCRHISMALAPFTANPHGYALWSLRDDAALRRDFVSALSDHGVSIAVGEGCLLMPGGDVKTMAADLEIMASLGFQQVNIVSIEPDFARNLDQFATFTEMAAQLGMATLLEMAPIMAIRDLTTAVKVVEHVGRSDFRLLLDALHLSRSGANFSDLACLYPATIGYAQLCDAPANFTMEQYLDEARNNRMVPGEGELPLLDMVKSLPRDVILGLEIPMVAKAEAGMGPRERLAPCVQAARELIKQAG